MQHVSAWLSIVTLQSHLSAVWDEYHLCLVFAVQFAATVTMYSSPRRKDTQAAALG
jgi:hypothetical protein